MLLMLRLPEIRICHQCSDLDDVMGLAVVVVGVEDGEEQPAVAGAGKSRRRVTVTFFFFCACRMTTCCSPHDQKMCGHFEDVAGEVLEVLRLREMFFAAVDFFGVTWHDNVG